MAENMITISTVEYKNLLRYKELAKEKISIEKKKGNGYKTYLFQKEFISWVKEHYPMEYEVILDEFKEYKEIMEEESCGVSSESVR